VFEKRGIGGQQLMTWGISNGCDLSAVDDNQSAAADTICRQSLT
jgi:hypothetical protein